MLRETLTREVNIREQLPHDLRRILFVGAWAAAVVGLRATYWYARMYWPHNIDAYYYWYALRRRDIYTTGPMTVGAFLYSPAFAQVLWPFARLPFPIFIGAVWATNSSLLLWLLKPLRLRWVIPVSLALSSEVFGGNIFIPLAAMVVLGFSHPGAWAFSALTKVSTTVMPLWWLVRREWAPLMRWAATTLVLAVASAALAPTLWLQWISHLASWATQSGHTLGNPTTVPLLYRAPLGIVLLVVGARRGWRWTVPAAAVLCTPVFWLGAYAWLAAIPRLQMRAGTPATRILRESASWPQEGLSTSSSSAAS